MPPVRTMLEDATVTALQPLLLPAKGGAQGGYLKKVAVFSGEDDFDRIREARAAGLPFVLVTTGDGTSGRGSMNRRRYTERPTLLVYVASGQLRSREAQNRGGVVGDGDPGAYQILEDVKARLLVTRPAMPGLRDVRPMSERRLVDEEADITVWELQLEAEIDVTLPEPAAAGPLEQIVQSHNLPAGEDQAANPVAVATATVASS